MTKIFCGLPGSFRHVVAHPIDEVEQLPSPEFRIEYFANLELLHPVHLDGQGDLHDASPEHVSHMWLQQADVEDRVDLHRRRQVQAVGGFPNRANDSEGPQAAHIQF